MRVFFRVFASQSADTDYDPNGTYASHQTRPAHPGTPVPGVGDTTIPFFATGNAGSRDRLSGRRAQHPDADHPERPGRSVAYYGCFLNFYDPANQVDGQQVQTLLPGHASLRRRADRVRRRADPARRLAAVVGPARPAEPAVHARRQSGPGGDAPRAADLRHPPEQGDRQAGRRRPAAGRADDRLGRASPRGRPPRSTGRRSRRPT